MRRRGQEEALGVRHRQDVGRRAEHVEQHRPVGEPRAEHLPDGEPDRQGRGEAEDERGDERGVRQAQPRHLRQRPHRGREGREEGPAAPVALVDQLVRVPVLGDLQVPATVPQRPHGLHEAQPGVDGRGDQRRGEDGHTRPRRSRPRDAAGAAGGSPGPRRRSVGAATRQPTWSPRPRRRRAPTAPRTSIRSVTERGRGRAPGGVAGREDGRPSPAGARNGPAMRRSWRQGPPARRTSRSARRGHRPRRSPPSWPPG